MVQSVLFELDHSGAGCGVVKRKPVGAGFWVPTKLKSEDVDSILDALGVPRSGMVLKLDEDRGAVAVRSDGKKEQWGFIHETMDSEEVEALLGPMPLQSKLSQISTPFREAR